MLPSSHKSGFGLSAMFVMCDLPALSMPCLAFQESWEEGHRGTPGMMEALIEMVLSFFEPIGRVTCKLVPGLWGGAMMRPKNPATLCAELLVMV